MNFIDNIDVCIINLITLQIITKHIIIINYVIKNKIIKDQYFSHKPIYHYYDRICQYFYPLHFYI